MTVNVSGLLGLLDFSLCEHRGLHNNHRRRTVAASAWVGVQVHGNLTKHSDQPERVSFDAVTPSNLSLIHI